jgi:hypothetical protein
MRREVAFRGQLVADLLAWSGGGLVLGGMFGYGFAETWNRIKKPLEPVDPVWVGNRDAYRGALFAFVVAACGHALRAIF